MVTTVPSEFEKDVLLVVLADLVGKLFGLLKAWLKLRPIVLFLFTEVRKTYLWDPSTHQLLLSKQVFIHELLICRPELHTVVLPKQSRDSEVWFSKGVK